MANAVQRRAAMSHAPEHPEQARGSRPALMLRDAALHARLLSMRLGARGTLGLLAPPFTGSGGRELAGFHGLGGPTSVNRADTVLCSFGSSVSTMRQTRM